MYIIINKLYNIKYIKDFQRMSTQQCMKCKQRKASFQFQKKCFCTQRICNKCNSNGYCPICNQPFRPIPKQQKGYDKIGLRQDKILIDREFKTQATPTYLKKDQYVKNQAQWHQVKPPRQTLIRNLTQTKTQQKLNQGYLQKPYQKNQYSRNQYIQVITKRTQQLQPTLNQLIKPTNYTRQNQIFRQERSNSLLDQFHQRQRQKKKKQNQTQTYEQQLAEAKRNISLFHKYFDKKCYRYIELIDLAISIDKIPTQVELVQLPTCSCTKQKKMILEALKGQCLFFHKEKIHSKEHIKLKNGFILCKKCYHQLHQFYCGDKKQVVSSEKNRKTKAWEYFQSQLYTCISCLQIIQNLEEAQFIDENENTRICKECIEKGIQVEKELERQKKNNQILTSKHINKEQNKFTPFKEEFSSQYHKYRTSKPFQVPKQVKISSENRAQKKYANRQPQTIYYPIKILTPEPADEKQSKICQVCFKVISHERFVVQKQGITICFTCDRSNSIAQNLYLKQNKKIYRQPERFYSVKKRENRYEKEEQSKLQIKPALNHKNYSAINQAPEKKETKRQKPLDKFSQNVQFQRYSQKPNQQNLPLTKSQYKQDSKHFQGFESSKIQTQNINSQQLKQKSRFSGFSPQKVIQRDAIETKKIRKATQFPNCLICAREIVSAIDVGFRDGNTITCSQCYENQRQALNLDKMSDDSKILQSNSKISRISDTNQQFSLIESRKESSTSKNGSQINHLQPVSQRSQSSVEVIKSEKQEDIEHSKIKLINHNRSFNAQSQKTQSEEQQSVINKSMFSNNDNLIEQMKKQERSESKEVSMRKQKNSLKSSIKQNSQQSSLGQQQPLISKVKTSSDDKSIQLFTQQNKQKQKFSQSNSRLGSIIQIPVQINQEHFVFVPLGSENCQDSGSLSHSFTRLLTSSLMQDSSKLKLDDSKMIPERDSSGQAPFEVEQTPILYKTSEGQSTKPAQKTVTQTQIKDVQCLITSMSSSGLSKYLEKDQLNGEKRKNDSFGSSMLLSKGKQENIEKQNKMTNRRYMKPSPSTSQHSESIQPSQEKVQLQNFYILLEKRHIQQIQEENKIIQNQKLDVDLKFDGKDPDFSEYLSCSNCQIFIGFGHGCALNEKNEYVKNSDEEYSVFICKKCYYEQVLNEQEIKKVQLEDERRYAIYRSLDKNKNRIREQGHSSRPQSVKKYTKIQQLEMNKKNTPNPYITNKQQPLRTYETSQKPSSLQYQLSSFTQEKSFLQQKLDQRTQPSYPQFSRHSEISQSIKSQLIPSPSQPTTSILQPQQKLVKSQIPIQQPRKICKICKRETRTICWTNQCLDCFNRKSK